MCPPLKPQSGQWRIGGILPATSRRWLTLIATPSASGSQLMRAERSASCSSVIPTRTIPTHNLSATQYAHMAFQHCRKAISACRKSLFSPARGRNTPSAQPVSVRFAPESREPSSKRARFLRHWRRIARFPFLGFPRTPFLTVAENLLLYRQTHMAFQHCRKAISYEQI